MADVSAGGPEAPKHKPYVPAGSTMREFTVRALVIGLIMSVVLGAANAYLGLKAGMTIAATYPAAVIGMAILRLMKGNILEENMARTVGSIGESVAAGAVFTIPAFIISGVWTDLRVRYFEATAIMVLGGLLGIFFVTLLRRVMVEDKDLPYPESVAAAEIHKAGRAGGTGALFLFFAGILGALIQAMKTVKLFAESWEHFIPFAPSTVKLGNAGSVQGSGGLLVSTPGVSPAYMGVGYIIGPKLSSLNFAGGLLAWGLFVPILLFFLGPTIEASAPAGQPVNWIGTSTAVWKGIVKPVAIGGMLVSAGYTLFRMRKNLIGGLKRSVTDVKKAAAGGAVAVERTERDLKFNWVLGGIAGCAVLTFFLYWYFTSSPGASIVATAVMIVAGFFFAAVSGYLVGMIGSSNNPISGLTLSTVIVAALLMVLLGQKGTAGIVAVLGVAGVICVSAAVAGEMLQDLKVGHILGGTPWKMQVGDVFGVILASLVMYFPLLMLHQGDIDVNGPGFGFGGPKLPAPQASLMAMVAQGIVGGQMAWPLIIVGMLMACAFILVQVRSPMLVCVGMYLPLETSFAIFVGGLIRGIADMLVERRKFNAGQKARVENTGVLLASGLIAGEALMGLGFAAIAFKQVRSYISEGLSKIGMDAAAQSFSSDTYMNSLAVFTDPSFLGSLVVFAVIALVLTVIPVAKAGRPEDPAPPSAVM